MAIRFGSILSPPRSAALLPGINDIYDYNPVEASPI